MANAENMLMRENCKVDAAPVTGTIEAKAEAVGPDGTAVASEADSAVVSIGPPVGAT